MGRPRNESLRADLKLSLPAPLLSEINLMLEDPLTRQPKYGARAKLIEACLRNWLAYIKHEPLPPLPSVEELRELF